MTTLQVPAHEINVVGTLVLASLIKPQGPDSATGRIAAWTEEQYILAPVPHDPGPSPRPKD